MPEVRRASEEDRPGAAAALADAFFADPVWEFFFPDPDDRRPRIRRFFEVETGHLPAGREMWVAGDAPAAAIWAPPGRWRPPVPHTAAVAPALARVFGRRLIAAARAQNLIERSHPEDEPHWYLHYLGAAPAAQGRGLGAALMAPVLRRCDEQATAAFLETSTPRARALYMRHGFEIVGELDLPGGGPRIWQMWRPSRPT
ncbi:MAG TPA: GNAT family N-acetyltransferase [Solirubrobacterales bacterium]|nr:GNAT family N-acetyltransferase [Solirubrobacterales bacterium]